MRIYQQNDSHLVGVHK